MNKVYAFEWCDCVYESAYGVMSLHETKESAYRAMRSHLTSIAETDRIDALRYGGIYDKGYKPQRFAAWRVREIPVWPAGVFGTTQ